MGVSKLFPLGKRDDRSQVYSLTESCLFTKNVHMSCFSKHRRNKNHQVPCSQCPSLLFQSKKVCLSAPSQHLGHDYFSIVCSLSPQTHRAYQTILQPLHLQSGNNLSPHSLTFNQTLPCNPLPWAVLLLVNLSLISNTRPCQEDKSFWTIIFWFSHFTEVSYLA